MTHLTNDDIRGAVREHYGKIAESGKSGCGCSITSCCNDKGLNAGATAMALGYSNSDVEEVPEGSNMGLGCGSPQAVASLKTGETVLDLGSGGGFDCFLAARRVGKSGHVIGVDMTAEMIERARGNAEKSGNENVEFRLGEIENLPVADVAIDVVISNCVINLSPEKSRVFQEAFRVLKPGGRLAISDIVATAKLPEELKADMALYTGCMAGASPMLDIEDMLKNAGFEEIRIEPKNKSGEFLRDWVPHGDIENYIVSATIEAKKPAV